MDDPEAIRVRVEAAGVAALALAEGLIRLLIQKNVITKQEAMDLCERLEEGKDSRAGITSSRVEEEAATILGYIWSGLDTERPD